MNTTYNTKPIDQVQGPGFLLRCRKIQIERRGAQGARRKIIPEKYKNQGARRKTQGNI